MKETIPVGWAGVLEPVLASEKSRALDMWLRDEEAAGKVVFPPKAQRFRALELTPHEHVKVVVLGQDPYHGAGQAHGLSFSVPVGVKVPPSLANIYKELREDCGFAQAGHGNLEEWAGQGVLLLNTVLSVEEAKAGSHQKRGWEEITDAIIGAVAARDEPCVFVLWGGHAQKKAALVRAAERREGVAQHLIIESPHPSPLSSYRGFFGSKPFSRANAFLDEQGRGAIDWRLPQMGQLNLLV